jgi:glucose-1-phosphate cytidylyltransferase
VKVVILCGGQGTRIRGVSDEIPKPMLPVAGKPILWHIMKYYASFGHDEFVLCLGHKGNVIKDFFLNYETHVNDLTVHLGQRGQVVVHSRDETEEWRVTLVETGEETQTGGRVARALKYTRDDEPFFLTYGDGVSDVRLDNLLSYHASRKAVLTVTGVMPPGRFGELQLDGQGNVVGFNEKPQVSGGLISGGFFVCEPEISKYLSGEALEVFEQEPMIRMVKEGAMAVYQHPGFWQCMDTPRDWTYLNQLATSGDAPWARW